MQILDNCVSRRHAKILVGRSGGHVVLTITDLDSANGTFVNQEQVLSSHPLRVGDVIEMGSVRLCLRRID
jgi:pSer/pThr/pTyr-binding forkhead associated (FHA) protein